MEEPAQRILHRLRRALADLDSAAVDQADRLMVLHELEYELAARRIKDVPGGATSPYNTFGEDRI